MASDTPRIGYIGVGLMGHGAAKNILAGGYPVTILGHRKREPVDDLVGRGATEAASARAVGEVSDIAFLCLPSAREGEAVLFGPDGLADGLRAGSIVVDSTTADPAMTRRFGERLAERDIALVDAPLGRTPKEAEAGKLSTYVGGDPATIARIRPILDCYADTIVETGALGSGTTCKLVNNFISIGTSALIAEAVVTAAKLGVDLEKLYEVVSAGGANSAMFQMMMPWPLRGDASALKGPIRIAAKDLRTYTRMAEGAGTAAFIAQTCSQVYNLAEFTGHAERFMPVLPGILAAINGFELRDLD